MIDDELADALFLVNHPGWTWDALQAAPADVIATMKAIDVARARAAG